MANVSTILAVYLVLLAALLVGGVLLQIFLSRRESKWPGLVLPGLSLALSLLYVMNVMDTGSVFQNVLLVAATLLIANIPTLVLLAIYWAAREKRRVKDQVDKMNINDL